jgi:hypothetical protein
MLPSLARPLGRQGKFQPEMWSSVVRSCKN